ncbi:MAG: hypothetical protein V4574_04015 [Pseudomonadota bacterium]
MRFKLLLAALIALLPVPALADVTAHYSAGDKMLVIEAEDGGNIRVSLDAKFTLIRRDGVDYAIATDATGTPKVARVEELLAMVRAQMLGAMPPRTPGAPSMDFALTAGGEETVAGYPGAVWKFTMAAPAAGESGEGTPPTPITALDFVISPDPALAPVGSFFRRTVGLVLPMMAQMFGDTNFVELADDLLAKGAPIRIGPMLTLASVDKSEIAADRFVLPGPVLTAAEFLEAVDPSSAVKAMPPAP